MTAGEYDLTSLSSTDWNRDTRDVQQGMSSFSVLGSVFDLYAHSLLMQMSHEPHFHVRSPLPARISVLASQTLLESGL